MRSLIIVLLHVTAILLPLSGQSGAEKSVSTKFQGWPTTFENETLTRLPLSEQEATFSAGFPGKIARFSDGKREIIMRYLEQSSRQLHPSADCLKGSGYQIDYQPLRQDREGSLWGCVIAKRDQTRYRVCEQITDSSGKHWYDVSSWFWATLLRQSQGPWLAVTVAESL
jgi:hypothetical protein